jgi:hypothetical protein
MKMKNKNKDVTELLILIHHELFQIRKLLESKKEEKIKI